MRIALLTSTQYSDEFVLDNYVWSAVKDGSDPHGHQARVFVYIVKAQNWATLMAMSRATALFVLSQCAPSSFFNCYIYLGSSVELQASSSQFRKVFLV